MLFGFISKKRKNYCQNEISSNTHTYHVGDRESCFALFWAHIRPFVYPVDIVYDIRSTLRNIRDFDAFQYSTTWDKQYPALEDNERGKKSSIADKRHGIYEHLNENIFKSLQVINNLEWSVYDYPISRLKLKYNLSDLKKNSDYNEAKIHWEHKLPKSITNPEQLEEKMKILNGNVDAFFDKEVLQYVMDIQWDVLTASELTDIPPLNHVSIPNTIEQIRRHDWIEGGNTKRFERYDNNKMEYYLNGVTIARVEPHLETHLSELLDIIRNHYTIRQRIQLFGREREQLLKEHGDLQKEIGDKIVSKIERKQYHTICEHCNDAAISPKPNFLITC